MTDTRRFESSGEATHYSGSPSSSREPQLDPASCPLLFRIGDKFRAFGLRPGSFLEYYPPPRDLADEPDPTKPVPAQVYFGPRLGEEYFLTPKNFRAPPFGAITYKVQPGGRLLYLEQNLG